MVPEGMVNVNKGQESQTVKSPLGDIIRASKNSKGLKSYYMGEFCRYLANINKEFG